MYNIYVQFDLPVLWWAFLCRSHYCLMSAVGQIEAEGRHSPGRSPQWELDPRRGSPDLQTPEREAAEVTGSFQILSNNLLKLTLI